MQRGVGVHRSLELLVGLTADTNSLGRINHLPPPDKDESAFVHIFSTVVHRFVYFLPFLIFFLFAPYPICLEFE